MCFTIVIQLFQTPSWITQKLKNVFSENGENKINALPHLCCVHIRWYIPCDFSLSLSDKKELVAWMKGHESAIHSISVHSSGRYAVTTSAETTHLWDLDTFQKKHKLNIKEDVGLLQVCLCSLELFCENCYTVCYVSFDV